MRIQKKNEQELARRKGAARRTIIQGIWLLFSFFLAYLLVTFLIDQEIFTTGMIRRQLSLPREIPEWAVIGGIMLVFVVISQFLLMVGFFIASPQGRRRTGDPSMYSRNKDPFDNPY